MIVKLKTKARVLLPAGAYELPDEEARRLLGLGVAETVNVPPKEETAVVEPKKPAEIENIEPPAKKRTRKRK